MRNQETDQIISVVADGAAFGAFIDRVLTYANERGRALLYFPESFEWLVLKSGVVKDKELEKVLDHPEDYIDSSKYMSWEQFFTEQLENITKEDVIKRYKKSKLPPYYINRNVRSRILQILPEQLRNLLGQLEGE